MESSYKTNLEGLEEQQWCTALNIIQKRIDEGHDSKNVQTILKEIIQETKEYLAKNPYICE